MVVFVVGNSVVKCVFISPISSFDSLSDWVISYNKAQSSDPLEVPMIIDIYV
jgi:hypothetical protein